jgi:hypothetical protein
LEEMVQVPLRKSVFRAILARVAVLCNERHPNSVSPYGGTGKVTVGSTPAAEVHVHFLNTPEEQSLELTPFRSEASAASRKTPQVDQASQAGVIASQP